MNAKVMKAIAKRTEKATTAEELRNIAQNLIDLADSMEPKALTDIQIAIMETVGEGSVLEKTLPFDASAIGILVNEGKLIKVVDRGTVKYMRK